MNDVAMPGRPAGAVVGSSVIALDPDDGDNTLCSWKNRKSDGILAVWFGNKCAVAT